MKVLDFQAFIHAVADGMTSVDTGIRTHRIFLHGAWTDERYEGDAELLVIVHDGQDVGVGATERGRAAIHDALVKVGFDFPFTVALITHSNWKVQGCLPGAAAYDVAENGIEIFRSATLG